MDERDDPTRPCRRVWRSGPRLDGELGLHRPRSGEQFPAGKLRARVQQEIENGWTLFVADDNGALAAMLALHLPKLYLDQLFVAPAWQGRSLGRRLLAFTRTQLPQEIVLRCVRENEKAWRWYEREGFVCEKEQVEPMTGFVMKHYRWKKNAHASPA